jgi:hypothetical protein
LQARALRQRADGRFAFYAKVQDVGEHGLAGALRHQDRPLLSTWLTSDQPAWLFIDSVDEAKLDGIRLERALQQIAEGVDRAENRAHIIMSCRHTDWQFRRDLARFNQELLIPQNQPPPPPPEPNELLISIIREEGRDETLPPAETSLIVVMAPLDEPRVRLFAQGKNVPNLDAFMAQIDEANLWRFARRPLDLEWLVEYWLNHRRFGTLAQLLEASINARLRESARDPGRPDPVDPARARSALERIGAALVFGRKATIAIPDPEIVLIPQEDPPLRLSDILPDWTPEHLPHLLARPVFDPATFGRVRLHNDNEGVVRSYLAAHWLNRLKETNLSLTAIFDLLFSNTYGVPLTRPSTQETAAWLATLEPAVATRIVEREPSLLLHSGDPASLPADVRRTALTSVVHQLAADDERLRALNNDTLKRFARDDIVDTVRAGWDQHHENEDVRALLLRLIALGPLRACADIAVDAAFGRFTDKSTQLLAGWALLKAADDGAKRPYAEYVVANCAELPTMVVWDCVDSLFPRELDIDDLITILSRVDVLDREGGLSLDSHGASLLARISSRPDLERLLQCLLEMAGPRRREGRDEERPKVFLPALSGGAHHLLQLCPPGETPNIAIDCALRLGDDRQDRILMREGQGDPTEVLQRTAVRRQAAFWHATNVLREHPQVRDQGITSLWELSFYGWAPTLDIEDLDWLLADGPRRTNRSDRSLAINAAMSVWRDHGSQTPILQRIEAVARTDPTMAETFDAWRRPQIPSPEEIESRRRMEERRQANAVARATDDQSWLDFIGRLRANPQELRQLRPPTEESIDARLYHLWQLLSRATGRHSRYAIETVAPLVPILGQDVADALRDGLIAHWRAWRPRVKSQRTAAQFNLSYEPDHMGIAGVTLEANLRPDWVQCLTSNEVSRATAYATLELNGFPPWLAALAVAHPNEVTEVLMVEARAELANQDPNERYKTLQDFTHADAAVAALLAPHLLAELENQPALPIVALRHILEVLSTAQYPARTAFTQLALQRFAGSADLELSSLYLSAAFAGDPEAAIGALMARLDTMPDVQQTELVQRVLPAIFGDYIHTPNSDPRRLRFDTQQRLVRLAFRIVRLEDDRHHPSGIVHGLDERDRAERARGAAFNQFVETKGQATFDALLAMATAGDFPVPSSRLRALAHRRAAEDSESATWPAAEAHVFEQTHEAAPQTTRDLQLLAMRRFADVQRDLLDHDFAQGTTLSDLPDETAVQNWVAYELRQKQGRAYSVEREVHAVDENEPDIRLRARATDASLPVEIKVADSLSLPDLEESLSEQLCGRYLRDRLARHGVLLLVHQKPRPRGWRDPTARNFLTFTQVVERLKALARQISGQEPDAPQPLVVALDVSSRANVDS